MISPSNTKKRRTKRSKKISTELVEEVAVTLPPTIEESKKKKGNKSKIRSSKKVHTMRSLYLDPIDANTEASKKTDDQILSDITQTLEMFRSIAAKQITKEERHPMAQQIIDTVLKEINEPDVVPDVDTSLA
jgi:hypothetical protein